MDAIITAASVRLDAREKTASPDDNPLRVSRMRDNVPSSGRRGIPISLQRTMEQQDMPQKVKQKENLAPPPAQPNCTADQVNLSDRNTSLKVNRIRPKDQNIKIAYESRLPASQQQSQNVVQRSMRKRVLSRVKEGVLQRTKSVTRSKDTDLGKPDTLTAPTTSDSCSEKTLGAVASIDRLPYHGSENGLTRDLAQGLSSQRCLHGETHYLHIETVPEAAALPVLQGHRSLWITTRLRIASHQQDREDPDRSVCTIGPRIINANILVKPMTGFSIEEIIGTTYRSSLSVGEEAICRVKVARTESLIDQTVLNRAKSEVETLCSQIELMLQCHDIAVFSVKVLYSCKNLPDQTTLLTRHVCRLQYPQEVASTPAVETAEHAQDGTLMAWTACSSSRDSIRYAGSVSSIRKSINPSRNEQTMTNVVPLERLESRLLQDCSTAGQRPVDVIPSQTPLPSPAQPAAGITQGSPDDARRMWRHLRWISKAADERTADDIGQRTPYEAEIMASMKRLALSNKRSVGEQTLHDWQKEVVDPSVQLDTAPLHRQPGPAYLVTSVPWL